MNEIYIPLHNHSTFSIGDGVATIDEYVKTLSDFGFPAMALTEHGHLNSSFIFEQKMKEAGLKPIIGVEAYVVDEYPEKWTKKTKPKAKHLTIYVQNKTGWKNLLKLQYIATTQGYYYKPMIRKSDLFKYNEGLIISTACILGIIGWFIVNDETEKMRNYVKEYVEVFKDRIYFEVMPHHMIPVQYKVNFKVRELAKYFNVPIIATNDAHYVKKEDGNLRKIVVANYYNKKINEVNDEYSYYIRTYNEMVEDLKKFMIFEDKEIHEYLENTFRIYEQVDFEIPKYKPHQTIPKFADDPLKEIVNIIKQHPEYKEFPKEKIMEELKLIEKKGFANYFLMVKKILETRDELGVIESPGRGSVGGSIVAYLLGIHKANPIKYKLLFERFLDKSREDFPDIDLDFEDLKRDEVKKTFMEKIFGDKKDKHSCQVITYSEWHPKGAIRDVMRVYGYSPKTIDRVSKTIKKDNWFDLAKDKKVAEIIKENLDIVRYAKKLVGRIRHYGVHAAGMIFTKKEIYNYAPVYKVSGNLVYGYEKKQAEKVGLVKVDFLGLKTLDVISSTIKLIKKLRNIDIELPLEFDDEAIYNSIFKKGLTLGVFQFNTYGMQKYLRTGVFDDFEKIVALVSLYRPGPMQNGFLDDYVRAIKGQKKINVHPLLKEITKDTHGLIIYQEQVMKIGELAGLNGHKFRKQLDKEITEKEIRELRIKFVKGIKKNYKVSDEEANQIFDIALRFAGYGFNRSHAVEYTIISYWTAWLKHYYTPEFFVTLLNRESGETALEIIKEASKVYGIKFIAPDINHSEYYHKLEYRNDEPVILLGLRMIKNFGESIVEKIKKKRPFVDLWDLAKGLGKQKLLNIVDAGFVDNFIPSRLWVHQNIDDLVKEAKRKPENRVLKIPKKFEEFDKPVLKKNKMKVLV